MPPGRNAFVRSERCAKSEVGASEGRTTKVGVKEYSSPQESKNVGNTSDYTGQFIVMMVYVIAGYNFGVKCNICGANIWIQFIFQTCRTSEIIFSSCSVSPPLI